MIETYLSDANDHVVNVRLERVNSAGLLVATEPYANTNKSSSSLLVVLLHLLQLASNMGEVLGDFASLSLDNNFPCIHCACNYRKEKEG